MALFLANVSIIKIMILGRWSSTAFMRYIRSQVMEWTAGLATSMLSVEDYRHACLDETADKPTELNPSIQCNLDAAVDSTEEVTFNGSVAIAQFPTITLDL